jgi:hypothetical protein
LVRKILVLVAALLWSAAVALGIWHASVYASNPGARDQTPTVWPTDSALQRDGVTLVIFLHPECPCSRASIAELAAIQRVMNVRPIAVLVGAGELDVPGALVHRDITGEAKRFGARTSGHVVVYDRDGRLAFSGGITGSRGHQGNNGGRQAVLSSLRTARAPSHPGSHAVFGCGLFTP